MKFRCSHLSSLNLLPTSLKPSHPQVQPRHTRYRDSSDPWTTCLSTLVLGRHTWDDSITNQTPFHANLTGIQHLNDGKCRSVGTLSEGKRYLRPLPTACHNLVIWLDRLQYYTQHHEAFSKPMLPAEVCLAMRYSLDSLAHASRLPERRSTSKESRTKRQLLGLHSFAESSSFSRDES